MSNNNGQVDSSADYCWTSDALKASLTEYFCSPERERRPRFWIPPTNVHVLDLSPPFTKIRLEYTSIELAYRAMMQLRRNEISPQDVLGDYRFHDRHDHDDCHESSALNFSSRPLQATLLTTQPLISPGWNRSNPPKFRRLIARSSDENEAILHRERQETRFVFVSNLFARPKDDYEQERLDWMSLDRFAVAKAIRHVMNEFDSTGQGVEVFLSINKINSKQRGPSAACCHIGMRSPTDAQALIQGLQGETVSWKLQDWSSDTDEPANFEYSSGPLYLDYAAITQRSVLLDQAKSEGAELPKGVPTRPECTSTTAHVHVPGLVVVEDFITEAQEAALMAVLQGPQAPWAPLQINPSETGSVKRRVQHYGYVFDYRTANVLRNRNEPASDCPAMPGLIEVAAGCNMQKDAVNVEGFMTSEDLEKYLEACVQSGEGWGLLAGVIELVRRYDFSDDAENSMKLRFSTLNQLTVNQYKPGEGIGAHVDTPSAFGDGLLSLSLNSGITMEFRKVEPQRNEARKKLVYLPRRSLVLMSGPARYEWEHAIVTRTTDVHNGKFFQRGLRISLTLRTALNEDGKPLPLVQSNVYPPIWGGVTTGMDTLRTPACERDHVHAVYDAIAMQWHHTRGRRGVLWPGATRFLQELEPGSIVADVGCGDGKYFPAIWQGGSYVIGTDISVPLLRTAFEAEELESSIPENRRVAQDKRHLSKRPAVCAADCMVIPLQSKRCDAAICIAVLHHLSTRERRRRCIEELVRIVKPGGLINIQAWALTQEADSRRAFAASDVYVPFNAQPKYLMATQGKASDNHEGKANGKSMAQLYSEALNAEYDDRKGLVVFQRYCHMYREGELEELLTDMPDVELVESGFEAGNYFIIVKVV